jgi:hypothetical protein
MEGETRSPQNATPSEPGPFLAKVISVLDSKYMGTLEVQLLREVGNDEATEGQLRQVKYLSPFYGVTNYEFITDDPDDYANTQKAYGMWFVPPDVGSVVMCIFVDGDSRKGYWIGCVQDENINFALPGYAATRFVTEDTKVSSITEDLAGNPVRVPVSDYNKKVHAAVADPTKQIKPEHPLAQILETQGLLLDDTRGITSSSARREVPSMVFGISTPGPIDKTGPKQPVGKKEYKIDAAFISRLGGSSFVMDDGDDKFLRKTTASEGPPSYAAVENGETEGDVKLLHNELIRLRTRTGHQILLHNTEDLIYIGNARGTAWVELSSDGKIDIFAADSISVHTKNDINFYADRDINIEAGRNFNVKVAGEMHTQVLGDQILIVDSNQKIHVKQQVDHTYDTEFLHHVKGNVNVKFDSDYLHKVGSNFDMNVSGSSKITSGGSMDINSGGSNNFTAGGSTNIRSGGQHIESASQIHMNGPSAATAAEAAEATDAELPKELKTHSLPDEEGNELVQSIMRRIPTHEPWPHHENLDPTTFKPENTDRDLDERYEGNSETINIKPEYWQRYGSNLDTFEKVYEPDAENPEEQ